MTEGRPRHHPQTKSDCRFSSGEFNLTNLDAPTASHRISGPRGIRLAQLEAALRRHAGVFSLAARELGVSRQAVFDRVRRSAQLQRIVSEIEETLLDAVDAGLADLIINKRDPATLRWYADRKGRRRGYGLPMPEILEPPVAPEVVINVIYVDANGRRHSEGPAQLTSEI